MFLQYLELELSLAACLLRGYGFVVLLPSPVYTYRSDSRTAEGREGQKGQVASFRQELAADGVLPAVRSSVARTGVERRVSLNHVHCIDFTLCGLHICPYHIHTSMRSWREKKDMILDHRRSLIEKRAQTRPHDARVALDVDARRRTVLPHRNCPQAQGSLIISHDTPDRQTSKKQQRVSEEDSRRSSSTVSRTPILCCIVGSRLHQTLWSW